MTRKLLSHLVAFLLGAAFAGSLVYLYHLKHMERSYVLEDPIQMGFNVTIGYDPPSEKIEESELWLDALQFAEMAVRRRLETDGKKTIHGVVVKLIARPDGYEALVFGPPFFRSRSEEIGKIIDEEIIKAQRSNAQRALNIIQRSGKSPARSPSTPQ